MTKEEKIKGLMELVEDCEDYAIILHGYRDAGSITEGNMEAIQEHRDARKNLESKLRELIT